MALTPVRIAIGASLFFGLCLGVLQLGHQGKALSQLEGSLLDLRFALRGERPAPTDLAILAIDNRSLTEANTFPLPRDVIGEAVEAAFRGGGQAVVLDLLLLGPTPNDTALTAALAKPDTTALAMSFTQESPPPQGAWLALITKNSFSIVHGAMPPGPNGVRGPEPGFAARAQLGHVDLQLDGDGALRRIPVALRLGQNGPAVPALSVVAARLKAGLNPDKLTLTSAQTLFLGVRPIPLGSDNTAVLNYYGPRGSFPTFSITQAQTADLTGKLVFIGATADGYRDSFSTPFDAALPGVEALATLTANLLDQTVLRRDQTTWILDVLLAILGSGVAAFAASRSRLLPVVSACAATWGTGITVLQTGFFADLWLDAVTLSAALAVGMLLGFAARWETYRNRGINLARYQSPQMVEALATKASPVFDKRNQHAAVVFVDLADFTERSATIDTAQTGALLNRFHTLVNGAAGQWRGVVSYVAGDGAMIVFGLPQPTPDDAARAFECAGTLLETIGADSLLGGRCHSAPVRIGAHCGDVYAMVLADEGRATPTVTGDAVNIASRLLDIAKTRGSAAAISDDLYRAAGMPHPTSWHNIGPVPLRGRSGDINTWVHVQPHCP